MGVLDDLANEASTAYSRAKATLLGGSGTATPAAPAQKAALTQPPVPNYDAANKIQQLAQRSGATDAAFAQAQQGVRPTYTAPSAGANPNVPPGGSAEAAAFRNASGMNGPPAPSTIAGEAAAPRNVQLPGAIQKGIDVAKQTFASQMPSLPAGDGLIARGARYLGNAGVGALKTIARVAEPVIEGSRIAQVAMDPTMTKGDVAQQAVEGGTRWGATAGGASLGAGVGAVVGGGVGDVVTVPVGAAIGGIAGYMGGDALVNRARAALGLGDKSPAQRSSDRLAAASPVASAAAAAPAAPAAPASNIVPGANGSTVQVNPDGSSQLASRPTTGNAPAAAAAGAGGAMTVSGQAKAATKKKTSPRAATPAAAASPVAAEAAAPDTSGIDSQIADLQKQQDALGLKTDGLSAATSNGAGTGWVGKFTDADGSQFSNKPMSAQEKALADRVSVIDAQGKPGETFEKDGKTYVNQQVGLDEIGKPLVKAFSADGSADGIGHDEALNLYRQHANFQTERGGVMSDDQAARVQKYLDLHDKISNLQSQKPQPDSYVVTGPDGNSNVVSYATGQATPLPVEAAGKGQEYRDATVKAALTAANPADAMLQQKLAEIALQNKGKLDESRVSAGATMGAAGITAAAHERATKYSADKSAESVKKNVIIQDETVDDGMGGVKVVKRAYNADGTPVGVQNQAAQGFQNGQVYKDPKTGVQAKYNNGKWEPIK